MRPFDHINIRPMFRTDTVPCDGTVGDIILISPLDRDEFDPEPQGSASLWVCIKSSWEPEGMHAVWARVAFDGVTQCDFGPAPLPPQNRPELMRG